MIATATTQKQVLFKVQDVCALYSISRSTLYKLLSAGKFPRPVDLGGPRWRASDLEKWANGLKSN